MNNNFFNILKVKKHFGFTLTEVMMAAGLVGLVGLGVMQVINQQTKLQKQAEVSYEVNALSTSVSALLRDSDACLSTLLPLGNLKTASALTQILNKNGKVLFQKGLEYPAKIVALTDMTISDFKVDPDPIPAGTTAAFGTLNLNLTMTKLSKIMEKQHAGQPTRLIETRSIPLKIKVDATYKIVECYSLTDDALQQAFLDACSSIGGTAAGNRCILKAHPQPQGNATGVSTAYVKSYTNNYESDFVNVIGDNMTGDLSVVTNISTVTGNANLFCVGSACRNLAPKNCPGGLVKGIAADGSMICTTINCPYTKYFAGLNSSGSAECRPFPTESCPMDSYVSAISPTGVITCTPLPPNTPISCPANTYLNAISSSRVPTCLPLPVDTNTNIYGKQCSSSLGIVTSIDGAGNLSCIDYCPACGACGKTRPVGISCSPYGSPINGTDQCTTSGWVRTANPWCYCPCGGCGAERSVWGPCSYGALVYGVDRCITGGWARIANPWCWCNGCSCGATRTVWVGTVPYTQVCDTNGWRY